MLSCSMKSSKLILDGNNILFKAYYVDKTKTEVNGVMVNPINKFLQMVKNYVRQFKPTEIYISWDKRLNPTGTNFRKDLIDYKGNRSLDDDTVTKIHDCAEILIEICSSLGFKTIYPWNLEADDVIAYICEYSNITDDIVIISSDKDLLQLVSKNVKVYNTSKNELITLKNFYQFTGVDKTVYVDYKAILGDRSDNIPGLDKYGEIKSKKLAMSRDYTTLNEDQLAIVDRNIKIMNLKEGYKHSKGEVESYSQQLSKDFQFNEDKFKEVCESYELYSTLKDLETWKTLVRNNNLLEEWFIHN